MARVSRFQRGSQRPSRLTFVVDNNSPRTCPEPVCTWPTSGANSKAVSIITVLSPFWTQSNRLSVFQFSSAVCRGLGAEEGIVSCVLRTDVAIEQLLPDATSRQGPGFFFVSRSPSSVCT